MFNSYSTDILVYLPTLGGYLSCLVGSCLSSFGPQRPSASVNPSLPSIHCNATQYNTTQHNLRSKEERTTAPPPRVAIKSKRIPSLILPTLQPFIHTEFSPPTTIPHYRCDIRAIPETHHPTISRPTNSLVALSDCTPISHPAAYHQFSPVDCICGGAQLTNDVFCFPHRSSSHSRQKKHLVSPLRAKNTNGFYLRPVNPFPPIHSSLIATLTVYTLCLARAPHDTD